MEMTISQQHYFAQWHEGFVGYIGSLLGAIAGLMARQEATHEEKEVLEGRDVAEVKRDLAAGVVKKSMLDKIEKINGDVADTCLAYVQMNPIVREFWKQMAHIQIAQNKRAEEMRLGALRIPTYLFDRKRKR